MPFFKINELFGVKKDIENTPREFAALYVA